MIKVYEIKIKAVKYNNNLYYLDLIKGCDTIHE